MEAVYEPKTLQEAIVYFSDQENCLSYLVARRPEWNNGVVCPKCGSTTVGFLKNQLRWQCSVRHPQRQFSIKVGTIFEDSPIGLDKWLPAMWMIVNAKNGISSCEIARALGVTQKTAWFMLHRIRYAIQAGSVCKFAGNVEVDETFIGGKARMMNAKQHKKKHKGSGPVNMVPVQGMLQREEPGKASRVALMHVRHMHKSELQGNVREYVLKGANVYTDENKSYRGLSGDYVHSVITHAVCYAKGHV